MNEFNVTQNRIKKDLGGYDVQSITSDSFITYVNVVENNQSTGNFNHHSCNSTYPSIFKINFCNYLRNKANAGQLIYSNTDLFMSYCCIFKNKVDFIFRTVSGTVTFENSTTDSISSMYAFPTFKYTYYKKCPSFYKTQLNDQNEEEGEYFLIMFVKRTYIFAFLFTI